MKTQTDITPAESIRPIYLETLDPKQQKMDIARRQQEKEAEAAKAEAKASALAKLGLTADEVAALFG